jgi:hypothetical protein
VFQTGGRQPQGSHPLEVSGSDWQTQVDVVHLVSTQQGSLSYHTLQESPLRTMSVAKERRLGCKKLLKKKFLGLKFGSLGNLVQ